MWDITWSMHLSSEHCCPLAHPSHAHIYTNANEHLSHSPWHSLFLHPPTECAQTAVGSHCVAHTPCVSKWTNITTIYPKCRTFQPTSRISLLTWIIYLFLLILLCIVLLSQCTLTLWWYPAYLLVRRDDQVCPVWKNTSRMTCGLNFLRSTLLAGKL